MWQEQNVRLQKEMSGNVLLLSVDGNIDFAGVADLEKALKTHIETGGARIVVDFSNVTYVDSVAMGLLLRTVSAARNVDGDLKLACVTANVLKSFQLSALDSVFRIYETVTDARDAFGTQA